MGLSSLYSLPSRVKTDRSRLSWSSENVPRVWAMCPSPLLRLVPDVHGRVNLGRQELEETRHTAAVPEDIGREAHDSHVGERGRGVRRRDEVRVARTVVLEWTDAAGPRGGRQP